jgi:hypothetical protein
MSWEFYWQIKLNDFYVALPFIVLALIFLIFICVFDKKK